MAKAPCRPSNPPGLAATCCAASAPRGANLSNRFTWIHNEKLFPLFVLAGLFFSLTSGNAKAGLYRSADGTNSGERLPLFCDGVDYDWCDHLDTRP